MISTRTVLCHDQVGGENVEGVGRLHLLLAAFDAVQFGGGEGAVRGEAVPLGTDVCRGGRRRCREHDFWVLVFG